jgi:hypothetical protein
MLDKEDINRRYKILELCIAEFSNPEIAKCAEHLIKSLVKSHNTSLDKIETLKKDLKHLHNLHYC